jgi:itaconyl-CoA hydratase
VGATGYGQGRYFEDFAIGAVYRSAIGRTVTEMDNVWFSCMTMNTNQIHFNDAFASGTRFGKSLMNSTFTLALVTGLSVADTSQNGGVNLEWTEIKLPKPVFAGDTIWSESEILALRESHSNPSVGIVSIRTRGINQRGEVICEYRRSFMIPKRTAAPASGFVPPTSDWTV